MNSICIIRKLNAANSDAVNSVIKDIEQWAAAADVELLDEADEHDTPTKDTLFVAIGGDGTVIHAAKQALKYDAPVLGFNLGKVGFLADFETKKVQATLHAAFEDMLEADERMVVMLDDDSRPGAMALNDFVISCKFSDTTFPYDLFIDRAFAGSHTANGVIICTPTGSTAYALAVGGAIIMPSVPDILQVVPIAPQTMTSRPLIVPASPGLTIKFPVYKDRPITIRADGQPIAEYSNDADQVQFHTVSITPIEKRVKLLHHNSWNHFDTLNKKLNWNK
jgi:NAD+ kinase